MRQLRIAVVENEKLAAVDLAGKLNRWNQESRRDIDLQVSVFEKGEAFLGMLKEAKAEESFHMVFLDIRLDGELDGMETAKQLRKYGGKQMLVFLTSYDSYILDGYDVDAVNYLLKPLKEQDLTAVMDKAVSRLGGERYLYRGKSETKWIPYEDIFYFQSAQHYVDIITTEGVLSQKCRLSDIEKRLPPYFLRCHRVNIVNMHQISCICGTDILMKNQEHLSISDSYREMIEAFMFRDAF